jgi:hypothetical protein
VVLCRPAARNPEAFRVASPLHNKKRDTRALPPGVGSPLLTPEEYDKLSSAIHQSRQGRTIVARYVSEDALALLKKVGRSGIYPRLSEAKGRVSKTNAPSLRRRPGWRPARSEFA